MEQRRLAGLLDRLVKRVGKAIVREKTLHRRMKLEALNAELLDEPARLARPQLALVRIDGCERNQDIAVFRRELRDLLVLVTPVAGLAFGVHGKDHGCDILLAKVRRRFRNGRRMSPRRAEIFRHRALKFVVAVIGMAAAWLFRMRVDVDRPHL